MENITSSVAKVRFADCDPIGHLNNVKYLEYMINAREDHVEDNYGFSFEEFAKQTGFTWITVQNQIAYLKEVRMGQKVLISSKIIQTEQKTSVVEILMSDLDNKTVYSVLWITLMCFNLKTRRSEIFPEQYNALFEKYLVPVEESNFEQRAFILRQKNKNNG